MTSIPQSDGLKMRLFQKSDPVKHWWSLDEMRVCAKCEHLFTGRDIRLIEDDEGNVHFHCPTQNCEGSWEDWQYPNLHL